MQPPKTILLGNQSGPINILIRKKTLKWCFVLLFASLLVAIFSISSGQLSTSFDEVISAFTNTGHSLTQTVVIEWRLPRLASSLLFGAALGVSGALFQSLIRNPLGSPDIIGFNTGSYTGALAVIILFSGSYIQIAFGAIIGGALSALIVYIIAYKGGIQGFRLIIIGIGISAMLSAFNMWMMVSANLDVAMKAAMWGAGSLNGMTWTKVTPSYLFIVSGLIIAGVIAKQMQMLEMGDDSAKMLGINTEKLRVIAMVVGVVLTAAVTAACGPISFISLVAPQLAQKLVKANSITIATSALMGAMLLTASDYLAVNLFAPNQLPVGIVTVSLGGIYLVYILIQHSGR